MADLLATVAVAYAVLTLASWRLTWLQPKWVVVGVGGSLIPDLQKVALVLDPELVRRSLGVPFDFIHLGTLGGVAIAAGVVTLLFDRRHWGRVYGLLVAGGTVHLFLDGMRVYADGRASTWLYPFLPAYRPPTPNLFVTSDPAVTAVALALALAVFLADRYRRDAVTTSALRR